VPVLAATEPPSVGVDRRSPEPLRPLAEFARGFDGRVLVVAEGAGRRETMQDFFREHGLRPVAVDDWSAFAAGGDALAITHGPVASGFVAAAEGLAVLSEAELYPTQVRQGRRRDARAKSTAEGMLRDLAEVKEGDPVVHSQHGIGRYMGLVTMDLGEGPRNSCTSPTAGTSSTSVAQLRHQPLHRASPRRARAGGQRAVGKTPQGHSRCRHGGGTPRLYAPCAAGFAFR
jgi:transcription-repair coupling factor (superfamily II helicase)